MSKGLHFIIPALLAGTPWASAAPTEITREQAEALVDQLAEIDQEDGGFSDQWMSPEFPPAPWQWTWADSGKRPPQQHHAQALLRLVDAGPSALPVLLAHLDDPRPTRITFKQPEMDGAMWFDTEVPTGPAALEAQAASGFHLKMPDDQKRYPATYQVKVGDICFAITGIITNRPYCAIRNQHKRSIVINSPVETPGIAAKVRGLWPNPGDPEALRQSLEFDFEHGNRGAAARLLYYFPRQSSVKVHARLQDLIASKSKQLPEFLDSISWAPDPQIRATIRELISSVSPAEYKLIAYGVPAFGERGRPELREESLTLLKRWTNGGPHATNGLRLLVIALETWPEQAEDTLSRYLINGTWFSTPAAIQACYISGIAPVRPLQRLLGRDESGDGEYLIEGPGFHQSPRRGDYCYYRTKDNSYELICRSLGDKSTVCTGTHAAMDARIAALQQRLSRDPATWPFSPQEIATRQAEREGPARTREKLLADIHNAEPDLLRRAVLTLERDGLSLDDWREAAAYLYGRPDGLSSHSRAITDPGLDEACRLDAFPVEWQKRCIAIMAKRCLDLWQGAGEDSYPTTEAATFLCQASRRLDAETKELRRQALQRLEAAARKQEFPERKFLRPTLVVAAQLLIWQTPGAAEWFATLSSKATPSRLDGEPDGEEEFLSIFAEFAYLDPLSAPAVHLFLDPEAPWNPATIKSWKVPEIGGTVPIRIPAFREALLQAIRDNPKRSEIVGHISNEDGKSVRVSYIGGGGMWYTCAPPFGTSPGQPPIEIRRMDALLNGIANYRSDFHRYSPDKPPPKAPGTPPAYQMHWPLDKREEAIREWITYLAK